MKLIIGLLLCLMFCGKLSAQDYSQAELTQSMIETEKKTIIGETMEFTEAESQAFWPVYGDFEKDWEVIFARKVDLLNQYADNHGNISDEQALELAEELIEIQSTEAKIRKEYLKKYKKILPGKKVARYYQLENKLAAVINYDLAEIIPLIE